jgi:hypothetical protein
MRFPRVSLVVLLASVLAAAQGHEPGRDEASVDLGKGKVTINYGTPKLGGRNLDEMIKPGTPWRLGMNDPTSLETTVALDFGGKKVPAGKYTLFARPDAADKWVLLVCSGRTANTAIAEAPLHFMKDPQTIDVLKITLEKGKPGASLLISWGTYRLHGSFKASA